MTSSDKVTAIFIACGFLGVVGALIVGWPALFAAAGAVWAILRHGGKRNG